MFVFFFIAKHTSFKYLQIQENVNNMLTKIFQKHGGYMISYPLLTPTNPAIVEFERIFKVTDSSGLVVSLPYNHRVKTNTSTFSYFFEPNLINYFLLTFNFGQIRCRSQGIWLEVASQTLNDTTLAKSIRRS